MAQLQYVAALFFVFNYVFTVKIFNLALLKNCTIKSEQLSVIRSHILLFVLLLFALVKVHAQENEYKFVQFESIFEEGIYKTFHDFFLQQPIKKESIVATENKNATDFLLKVLSYERFTYFDSTGSQISLKSENIWGIVHKNALYIFYGQMLSKVYYTGRWSHFITHQIRPRAGTAFTPGGYYAVQVPLTAGQKAHPMLIDLQTGEIIPFDRKELAELMLTDSALQAEYKSLPKRKQKQLKYLYLRKLNDKYSFQLNPDNKDNKPKN